MTNTILKGLTFTFSLSLLLSCQSNIFGDDCLRLQTLAQENARPIPLSDSQKQHYDFKEGAVPLVIIEPQYPRKAAMCGIEGWVRYEFTVKKDGSIKNVNVLDSSPEDLFVSAGRRALYKWRFKPALNNEGKPIESQAFYTIEFKLSQ